MQPARHIPRYTYKDYLLWQGEWEMIDGVPHAMSPSATGKHQWMASLLTTEIVVAIRQISSECGHCFSVQDVDWVIDDNTVLRPDLAVVCFPLVDYITSPPSIIIEILSPSSGHHDRIVKREIYEEQGVKYYIIVDIESKTFAANHLVNGKYEEYTKTIFDIHDDCTITIDVKKILGELKE